MVLDSILYNRWWKNKVKKYTNGQVVGLYRNSTLLLTGQSYPPLKAVKADARADWLTGTYPFG